MADDKGSGHKKLALLDILTDVLVIGVLKKVIEDKGAKIASGSLPTEDEAIWSEVLIQLLTTDGLDGARLHRQAMEMFAALDQLGEKTSFIHLLQADYHRILEVYKGRAEKNKDPIVELTDHVREILKAYPDPKEAAEFLRVSRAAQAHWITKVPDLLNRLWMKLGLSDTLSAEDTRSLIDATRTAITGGALDELTATIEADTARRRAARQAREANRREGDGHTEDGGGGPNRPRRRRKRGGVWFATIYLIAAIAIAIIASNYDARHLMSGPTPAWQKVAEDAATSAAGAEAATGGSTRHWYNDSMLWLYALLVALVCGVFAILIALLRRPARRSNGPDRDDDHRYGAARTGVDEETTFTDITN